MDIFEPLQAVTYTCTFGSFMMLPGIVVKILNNGLVQATYYSDAEEKQLAVVQRFLDGHKNLVCENLTPFVGIALACETLKVSGLSTAATIFVLGRAVHYVGSILNPPFVRTVGFVAGWVATVYMGYAFCEAFEALEAPTEQEETLAYMVYMCLACLFMFIPYDVGRIPANGITKLTYYTEMEEAAWIQRGKAAHLNLAKENLSPFVGLVLVAAKLGVTGTAQPALVFLVCRVAMYCAAYGNVPFTRTVPFVVGWLASIYLCVVCYQQKAGDDLMMLAYTCAFTLCLFIPYDVGRIPKLGILNLTYYSKDGKPADDEGWIKRGKAAHLHMAGECLPTLLGVVMVASELGLSVVELYLPVVLLFRVLHYLCVFPNPPFARTLFFTGALGLTIRAGILEDNANPVSGLNPLIPVWCLFFVGVGLSFIDKSEVLQPGGSGAAEPLQLME